MGQMHSRRLVEGMTQRAIVLLLTALLLSAVAPVQVAAQDVDGARRPLEVGGALRPLELGINFERVKRTLASLPASDEDRSLLHLNYYLSVYGRAPGIKFLEGFDLISGPVPFGVPTHAAFQDLWTPEEFSAPVADVGSLVQWLFNR